jgi:hypothetical protein
VGSCKQFSFRLTWNHNPPDLSLLGACDNRHVLSWFVLQFHV